MPTRYFRAGVGTVLYNQSGQVAFFKRATHPVGLWQFQQGGIDHNEAPLDTLWRELKEEVGLSQDQVTLTGEFPNWVPYQDLLTKTDVTIPRLGQVHRWFFLLLNENEKVNLTQATDIEFDDFKWISFEEAIAGTSDHKKPVYKILHDYFLTQIHRPLI